MFILKLENTFFFLWKEKKKKTKGNICPSQLKKLIEKGKREC